MKSPGKREMAVLAAASVLATVGIVWLVIRAASGTPRGALAVLGHPQVLWCLALIGGGLLALAVLLGVLIRLKPAAAGAPRAVHGDQGGTAAIEMVFVFPLALMIFLCITQAALLFNANMVVHYATFAAVRVAIVAVPMNIGSELDKLVWPCSADSQGPSEKVEMMRQAAVLALVPISAALSPGEGSQASLTATGQMMYDETRHAFSYADGKDQWWFHRVRSQYSYANAFTKIELAAPQHWRNDGNPDNDCPNGASREDRDTWTDWGWARIPYCPYYHGDRTNGAPIWDYNWYEELLVRVTYDYLLEVPYASWALGEKVEISGLRQSVFAPNQKTYVAKIRWSTGLTCEGGPEIAPRG